MKDCSFNTLLLSRGWPHCWVSEVFFRALKALLSFSFVWGVGVGPFATVYLGMSKESFPTSPRGWILETEFGSSALVTGTFPHTPLSQVISIMPVGTVTFYVVCASSFSSDSAGDTSSHQTTGKEAMLFKKPCFKIKHFLHWIKPQREGNNTKSVFCPWPVIFCPKGKHHNYHDSFWGPSRSHDDMSAHGERLFCSALGPMHYVLRF